MDEDKKNIILKLNSLKKNKKINSSSPSSTTIIIILIVGILFFLVIGILIYFVLREDEIPEESCETIDDCPSGYNCIEKKCLELAIFDEDGNNVNTGAPGAPCLNDSNCRTFNGYTLGCINNICSLPGKSMGEQCEKNSDCFSFLVCSSKSNDDDSSITSQEKLCIFPNKPYKRESNITCPPGYEKSSSSSSCLVKLNQPCNANNDCSNGICSKSNSGGYIFKWSIKFNMGWTNFSLVPEEVNNLIDIQGYSNSNTGLDSIYLLTEKGVYMSIPNKDHREGKDPFYIWILIASNTQNILDGNTFVDSNGNVVSNYTSTVIDKINNITSMSVSPSGDLYICGMTDQEDKISQLMKVIIKDDISYIIFFNSTQNGNGIQYIDSDSKIRTIVSFSIGDFGTSSILGSDLAPIFLVGSTKSKDNSGAKLRFLQQNQKYNEIKIDGKEQKEVTPEAYNRSTIELYNSIKKGNNDGEDPDNEDVALIKKGEKVLNFLGQLETYNSQLNSFNKLKYTYGVDKKIKNFSVNSNSTVNNNYVLNGPASFLTEPKNSSSYDSYYIPSPGLSENIFSLTGEWGSNSKICVTKFNIYVVSSGLCI